MKTIVFERTGIFVLMALLLAPPAAAQMVDPGMDRDDEPFCYYSKPTDVLGVMDAREGTLVTPEGYFYTGYGELMLFAGNPPVPVAQRVKTLYGNHYPVIEYAFTHDELQYRVQAFAATLSGRPEDPLINFLRVRVSNPGSGPRVAWLGLGLRYQNEENTDWKTGDNRFARPAVAELPGTYEQEGAAFSREWVYGYGDGMVLRDGQAMLLFPRTIEPEHFLTWKTGYNEPLWEGPQAMDVLPTTPVGNLLYRFALGQGQARELEFLMPYAPLDTGSTWMPVLRRASYDEYFRRTVAGWDSIFASGIRLELPEAKVVQTFDASLVYDLIARDKVGEWYIQKVNEFQYDSFWLRDAAHIARMYDLSGYHELARQCLEFFGQWQRPDGNFLSHGGQYDGWGQALWAYGQHFEITGDRDFARKVYPSVQRAVAWLREARQQDSLRLMPPATPEDNENISGHVTGHSFWALAGLRSATVLAEGSGHPADTAALGEDYRDYLEMLGLALRRAAARAGGSIPPGLDVTGGQDWGNLLAVYPVEILDPHDPMVGATLQSTRAKYEEGLMTYGDGRWLHHYLSCRNAQTSLVRGEQELVISDLYAMLVHTSATHAGFEFSIRPWGSRDFGMNLAPHGWFAAEYRTLLRNMLIREEGGKLHLLSALSPEWVKPGARIGLQRAPTSFGNVSFTLEVGKAGAHLAIEPSYRKKPQAVIVHLPWFARCEVVQTARGPAAVKDGAVVLPPDTREIEWEWTLDEDTPTLSYRESVRAFTNEYRARYSRYRTTGEQR